MRCKKCNESLHPEQKECLSCGTPTDKWPGGAPEDEGSHREIPWAPISIIGGGLLLALILFLVVMNLRVVPPRTVAENWVKAVAGRRVDIAKRYTTEQFEDTYPETSASLEKSEEYFDYVRNKGATYSVSDPIYDRPKNPTLATVEITLDVADGDDLVEKATLIRQGPEWKITSVGM